MFLYYICTRYCYEFIVNWWRSEVEKVSRYNTRQQMLFSHEVCLSQLCFRRSVKYGYCISQKKAVTLHSEYPHYRALVK